MPASGSGSLEFTDDVTADRRINYEVNCHQNNLQSFWYQNFENATVLVYYRLKLMSATHVYKCSSPSLHSFSGQPARTRQDIVSECDVTTRRNISFITCQSVCLWISQRPTLFNHFTTYGNNIGNVKAILTAIVHVLRVTALSTAYYIWSLPCLLQSSRVDMFCACWGFLRVPRHTFQRQTGDSLLATGQYVSMSTAHLRAVDLSKV